MSATQQILEETWRALEQGVRRARHPFHTGVLGTVGQSGPELRTVVLRGVDADSRSLICHTDARSSKLDELERFLRASWLFYDPQEKVQLRFAGRVELHRGDELARQQWGRSPAWARRCYGVEAAPGTAMEQAGSALPEELVDREPTIEQTEPWFSRFAVLETRIERMDWLRLSASGHRRARFRWEADGLTSTWIVP